jgi:PHB/PHA accumulation regulator DNA-binding domain
MSSMQRGSVMAKENKPITIKKYANRRLYNTGTSAYITLEDLAAMVKKGDDFVVFDAKSGDDIYAFGADPNHFRTGRKGRAEPYAD